MCPFKDEERVCEPQIHLSFINVKEVPLNMYCISSATEFIIIEVSQNIPIYTHSVTLAYHGIFIIIYLKAPAY